MLSRKIEQNLLNWKSYRNKALLITGARQIGKTFSIREFSKNNFESFIEINFVIDKNYTDLFVGFKNYDEFIINLSFVGKNKLKQNKTIIFFDEIQALYKRRAELISKKKLDSNSIDLITILKKAVEENQYKFVLSGSLLGVTLDNVISYPVGYMDTLEMFPLDFEEFLLNKGIGELAINSIKESFNNKNPISDSLNESFLDLFREYVLVGGMPEVVDNYLKTKNINQVEVSQKNILAMYKKDIGNYIKDDIKKLRINNILKNIPSELNNKNKRFISSHILSKDELKHDNLSDEFLWLSNAGIAITVYNVDEPILPLKFSLNRKTMKLFMNDIGLFDSLSISYGVREKLLKREEIINFGSPYENAAAQQLYSHGFKDEIFYYNSKKHGEVDFIIEHNNIPLPIEIKSGKADEQKYYNHTALNNLIKIYNLKEAYVFGETNIKRENDKIWQLPIYMISFINK